MEWVALVVIMLVAAHWWKKIKSRTSKPGRIKRFAASQKYQAYEDQRDVLEDDILDAKFRAPEEQIIEIITSNGEPAFKYRFHATLDFNTPSDVLRKHRKEEFIERPGGNRDPIQEEYGWWAPASKWERPEWIYGAEEERFKYVGGPLAYIEFLLIVRSVYEDANRTPQAKRDGIRKVCEDNKRAYAVQHFYQPPWETLIIPVLSLAEGFGPHKVGLMVDAGIRTVYDIESRSDKELAAVKGIGKASVAALRHLAGNWPYDKFTDCIEKDEQYRTPTKL